MGKLESTLDYAKNVVAKDPFATFLGIKLISIEEGKAKFEAEVKPEYANAVERAHGAFIYAMADQAFAASCNSVGYQAVALTVTIHYLSGAPIGSKVFSEATAVTVRRKISLWQIEVKSEDGELIATAEGTAYHR